MENVACDTLLLFLTFQTHPSHTQGGQAIPTLIIAICLDMLAGGISTFLSSNWHSEFEWIHHRNLPLYPSLPPSLWLNVWQGDASPINQIPISLHCRTQPQHRSVLQASALLMIVGEVFLYKKLWPVRCVGKHAERAQSRLTSGGGSVMSAMTKMLSGLTAMQESRLGMPSHQQKVCQSSSQSMKEILLIIPHFKLSSIRPPRRSLLKI